MCEFLEYFGRSLDDLGETSDMHEAIGKAVCELLDVTRKTNMILDQKFVSNGDFEKSCVNMEVDETVNLTDNENENSLKSKQHNIIVDFGKKITSFNNFILVHQFIM